jgi:hypothetical protein
MNIYVFVCTQSEGKAWASPLLLDRKPRANTSLAFIPFVKSLCESEILVEREDGASLGRAAT